MVNPKLSKISVERLKTLMIIYECDARGHKNCPLGGYQSELVRVHIKVAQVDW